MGINTGTAGRAPIPRWQIASLIGTALVATGATGTMAWRMASAEPRAATAQIGPDETRLLAKAEEAQVKRQNDAKKLKQADVGSGYQVDPDGNLIGPSENADLPQNKALDDVIGARGGAEAEIAKGIQVTKRGRREASEDSASGLLGRKDDRDRDEKEEKVQRAELEKSMLGYSTVKGAKWAALRPETGDEGDATKKGESKEPSSIERAISSAEQRLAALRDGAGSGASPGMSGGASAGPSKGGADLMPAEEQAQAFTVGAVGDMRIGGDVGPAQIIRQGKFIDCVIVNEVRADLMESPVIGMVSRDFVSLDGEYVLVPAGAKLIGTAGRVQNLQQARVYIRFDRVIFPDQRNAYFPVRRLPAVDGAGAAGVEGDVDRHFFLMFGSAVMLGILDGLAAAVEGANNSATPGARELLIARTSMNMSQVVSGILARYGNVVPTITVEAGSKMKVFFAEDVRMSPYMRSRELSWVKHGGAR